ncbi:MAG: alpha/beta fold hydrolase [Thermoguttaceae bacterium]|jgi:cephalosporin-C deacetylase-like acetyl esterase|nr:alpha/beta fold hydrolase [Thermoguttaceae bacterium]
MHRQDKNFAIMIAAISAVCISAAADAPVNLAPNPGFELADGGEPAFWEQRTPTDHERTLAWDAQVARAGTRSLRIDNRGPGLSRWRYGHLRDFALEPGSRGELTAWIKCDGAKGSAHTKLYFLDPEGGIITQPQGDGISGTRDWTQTRQPFEVPEKTAYVMIYLELNGEGTAWFDDVVLTGAATRPSADMRLARLTCGAENFDRRVGFVPRVHRRQPTVELPPGVAEGRVELVFHGESARYDVAVNCLDRADAGSRLRLLLGGKPVGEWSLAETEKDDEGLLSKVVSGVDIQRGSRIVLEGRSDGGRCRIGDIAFTPVGRFQGNLLSKEELGISPSLRIFDAFSERPRARGMLPGFISRRIGEAVEQRNAELAALRSPDDWRKRQQATRERLDEIFGSYGPRTPLNARIVGKIDRPDCVIEKLIFESQPGYHCTANFYVPKNRPFPRPGVLFTCGHAVDGKAAKLYHECCLGLVAKGYVVLALDPTGQGERLEYFDWETGQPLVPPCVAHHHYLSRPSWLVGRSLAGYRSWDGTRAIDYLVDREEVDREKIAVVGNSGGGIMALLITAFDERVKVCAAAHPGGSMEQTFLAGRRIVEADILSLIPPRPCLMVVGRDSGEEAGHRAKMANMFPFYEGLGVSADRCQMALVDGVHNMEQPKREPCYGWLNKWFDREEEGSQEPPLEIETVEALRCTETGYTLRDLGGESGQTLNAQVAAQVRPPRAIPDDSTILERQREEVKAAAARRLGLNVLADRPAPEAISFGEYRGNGYSAKKLLVRSEDGIDLPSLLCTPAEARTGSPVILYVSEFGKPVDAEQPSLALELVRQGHTVFAVDVRGSGETDPRVRDFLSPVTHYDAAQFRFDSCAVEAAQLNTTMLAMRAYDVVRSIDYLAGREGLAGRPVVLVGEGLGGVWALVAAAFDARAAGVVCVETVPSYKLIVDSRYYALRDYYWVVGALEDYDIPDLPGLIAPRPVLLLDPLDAMLEPLESGRGEGLWQWPAGVYQRLGAPGRIRSVHTGDRGLQEKARQIVATLAGLGQD